MARNLPTYATESDLRDIYPNIDKYDAKKPVYGWVSTGVSNFYKSYNTGLINVLFFDGIEGTAVTDDPNANYEFRYSEGNDSVEVYIDTGSPADMLMESGEDWVTHKTDLLYKASRYFDSYVDASLPQRMHKNSEGEYPYLVIRTTAQICAYFLISSHDPENEDGLRIKEEYEEILDKLVNGQIKLDYEKSSDSAKGVLRELYSDSASTLKPLDIIGTYTGSNYDKILIKIHTSGYIGQAKFNAYVRNGDALGVSGEALGANVSVTEEIIDGSYQQFASGLYVRFGATTPLASSIGVNNYLVDAVCTGGDAYEVEVYPKGAEIDDARGIKSANLTRS